MNWQRVQHRVLSGFIILVSIISAFLFYDATSPWIVTGDSALRSQVQEWWHRSKHSNQRTRLFMYVYNRKAISMYCAFFFNDHLEEQFETLPSRRFESELDHFFSVSGTRRSKWRLTIPWHDDAESRFYEYGDLRTEGDYAIVRMRDAGWGWPLGYPVTEHSWNLKTGESGWTRWIYDALTAEIFIDAPFSRECASALKRRFPEQLAENALDFHDMISIVQEYVPELPAAAPWLPKASQ